MLSANTGHLDLIADENCYALEDQAPVPSDDGSTEGWGESSPDEVAENLERIYTDRGEAARRGAKGAEFMRDLGWRNQVDRLLSHLADEG